MLKYFQDMIPAFILGISESDQCLLESFSFGSMLHLLDFQAVSFSLLCDIRNRKRIVLLQINFQINIIYQKSILQSF